jgi:exopolysaccharide biosynthesis polyprenyl glycosylphosphotransferase
MRSDTPHRHSGVPARRLSALLVAELDVFALFGPVFVSQVGFGGVLFAACAFLALRGAGQQRAIHPRLTEDVRFLLRRLGASFLISATATLIFSPGGDLGSVLRVALVSSASVLIGRAIAYRLLITFRRRGLLTERVAFAGLDLRLDRLAQAIRRHPESGLLPVGVLGSGSSPDMPLPPLGGIRDVGQVARSHSLQRIFVAPGGGSGPGLDETLLDPPDVPAEIYLLPRAPEVSQLAAAQVAEEVWGFFLVRIPSAADRRRSLAAKRAFDIAVSVLILVLTLPVLGIATLAVRVSSPGPILFHQKRVGKAGEIFTLLKLRTMRVNDDSDTRWTVEDDPRITPVGRILRRLSVDELPQLINVLRGEMSLVGPRPERPYFVDRFRSSIPDYEERLRVLPGLTGWAQINGLRGDTSVDDRSNLDNAYVEGWSFWHDIVILARTFEAVLLPDRPSTTRS